MSEINGIRIYCSVLITASIAAMFIGVEEHCRLFGVLSSLALNAVVVYVLTKDKDKQNE